MCRCHPSTAMETVCLKCGDRGFPETLVFCNGCQACALHRYCLDGPVIFWEEFIWFCEDCDAKQGEPSSLDQSIPVSSETSDSISLEHDAIKSRKDLKNCISRVKKNKQQAHKVIEEEEQKKIKVSNQQQQKRIVGEKQKEGNFINQPQQRRIVEEKHKQRKVSNQQQQKRIEEEKQKKRKLNPCLVTKTKALLSDSDSLPQLEHTQFSNSSEETSELKNEHGPLPRDAANSNVRPESVQDSLVANNHESNCAELDHDIPAQPIANPIWRGSFNFCNETIGIINGLLAHMSSLACYKVLEETKLLSDVLCADLLPRSTVWPKSFENGGPTDQSIALYFFPDSERVEKAFDMLVDDSIQHELAIRVMAENAELLIFPSTVLPLKHRRFQAKYYLWGVFRVKQTSHKTNDDLCKEDAKLLTKHKVSPLNTLSNSGSHHSDA